MLSHDYRSRKCFGFCWIFPLRLNFNFSFNVIFSGYFSSTFLCRNAFVKLMCEKYLKFSTFIIIEHMSRTERIFFGYIACFCCAKSHLYLRLFLRLSDCGWSPVPNPREKLRESHFILCKIFLSFNDGVDDGKEIQQSKQEQKKITRD